MLCAVPWYMMLCGAFLVVIVACYIVEGIIWVVKRW